MTDTGWVEGPRGTWTRIVDKWVLRVVGFIGVNRCFCNWDWSAATVGVHRQSGTCRGEHGDRSAKMMATRARRNLRRTP